MQLNCFLSFLVRSSIELIWFEDDLLGKFSFFLKHCDNGHGIFRVVISIGLILGRKKNIEFYNKHNSVPGDNDFHLVTNHISPFHEILLESSADFFFLFSRLSITGVECFYLFYITSNKYDERKCYALFTYCVRKRGQQ